MSTSSNDPKTRGRAARPTRRFRFRVTVGLISALVAATFALTAVVVVVGDSFIVSLESAAQCEGRLPDAPQPDPPELPYSRVRHLVLLAVMVPITTMTATCLCLLWVTIRGSLLPLARVVDTAETISGGDLSARTGISAAGEFGDLCTAIDGMAAAMQRREEQVIRSEKLASVGRLAAGVAHEVNNPLTGVLTFAHLMRSRSQGEQDRLAIDVIIRETMRIREIVRGLLDFARMGSCMMRVVDINVVIGQVLTLMRSQKGFLKVSFSEQLHPGRALIWGDLGQLQQVFLNLLMNAAQSMPDGGVVTVSTELRGTETVIVSVADSGCGITEEVRARLFEPFFTTKPVGAGSGLGLSISLGIVHQHRGTISVESTVGRGSTFTVELPAANQDAKVAEPEGGVVAEAS
jgi:two-component system NtrC family sensor kinase